MRDKLNRGTICATFRIFSTLSSVPTHLDPESEHEVTSCFPGSGPCVMTKSGHYLGLSHGSDSGLGRTGFRGRFAYKKKPVRKRAKGRIRFGLSLDEKKPRYEYVVKFF